MARCDDRNISDAFETLPTTLLSGSDEPSALDLEDDSIVQPTVHLHGGKWHMQTDDFATTSQMGHVDAHGQPRTRGPTTIVWYCSEYSPARHRRLTISLFCTPFSHRNTPPTAPPQSSPTRRICIFLLV
ncbi:hypothetical protein SNOG_02865 [Parastagonospora nodorum SN15]|uniref:Uncharacterized protein n=1 Tax=Phaeosphaeria nodorum (strain SN15 / ATCC MYA-4574 / FGSC 10173) TaxID=321614 RepID=Q0UZE9_PHANO|nr:hypothetical protein SNOG_02865 [Parastagonospora nodorum SN15]EAT89596.1 hypothetical protein SNOG_02865 [Parastagonospora nodorum SN15]